MYSGTGMSLSMIQARKNRRGKRAELPEEITKRLKSCSVLNCEDWRDIEAYTTYHCFPTGDKNQDRWEIWTQLLRKAREEETWIPFRGSLVCSHHFRPEDFVSDPLSKRRKLIKNAIPSIFPSFIVDLTDPAYQISDEQPELGDGTPPSVNASNYENAMYEAENAFGYEYFSTEDLNSNNAHEDVESLSPLQEYSNYKDEDQIMEELPGSSSNVIGQNRSSIPPLKRYQSLSTTTSPIPRQNQFIESYQSSIPKSAQMISVDNTVATERITKRQPPFQNQSIQSPLLARTKNKGLKRNVKTVLGEALKSVPISLCPDLEIEIIDPEEDLAVCRQRISELEQQNQDLTAMYENALQNLKEKYERQILILKRKLQHERERLHVDNLFQGNESSRTKKIRLG